MMPNNSATMRSTSDYEKAGDFPTEDPQAQDQAKSKEMRRDQMQALGSTLAKQRDEWISARRTTGWDKRIQEDLDQYHARDRAQKAGASMMESVEQGYPVTSNGAKQMRSTVYIGLTRQKSNAAEARLSDILLPTDEENWGIQPTPIPTLSKMLTDNSPAVDPQTGGPMVLNAPHPDTGELVPTQVKKSDVALAAETMAREKSENMAKEIKDQLIECDYNAETRKVLHDAAVMGVGVIKGPIVMNRTKKSWGPVSGPDGAPTQGPAGAAVYALEIVEEKKPASYHVDPRFVWEDPDCGDDIQNGKGIYELEQKTRKRVRELAKQPGYMLEQLQAVLEEGPKRSVALVELTGDLGRNLTEKTSFDVWSYTGEMDPDDLRLCGCDVPEGELDGVSGCVVMINDTVVKAYLNPIETGDLPYDFYPWEKVSDSPRGYGVPYLMRSPQRVINAAWRMMMDNAAICAGPQIIIKKGKIHPEDKNWSLYARKVWMFTGSENESVNDAFTQVEFNMHQAELQAIITLGTALADAETSTPMIAQGEQGSAPDTVGGTQLLMNSANVVLRRLVKQYDDFVTKRHIRRYYDYNMAYSEDDAIKGDFSVDARGSSALLVRDIQNQAFTNLLAAGANPIYVKYIDTKKLFEKALQAQHVQPQDIMKSDAEVKADEEMAAKNPPQDPRIQAATITANAKMEESKAFSAGKESEIQLRREISATNFAAELKKLELDRELAVLKYAEDQKLTIIEAKTQLAQTAINNRTKAELYAQEQALKLNPGNPSGEGI
jgi:hypothetical protein